MVLGLGKKNKGSAVTLVFDVSLVEVKPWPSSTLPPALVIQWQRGDKRSGSTKVVTGERDRILLNHSFAIPVTLYRLAERSKSGGPRFQKKCIVFSLCEAGEQGSPRGQPLGRAVLDLADYGGLKDSRKSARSSIPLAVVRKEFSVLGTPCLSLAIAPQGVGLSAAVGEDKAKEEEDHASLIASLVSDEEEEEDEEDDEIAAFTDDEEEQKDEEHADKSHHQQAQDKERATTSAAPAPAPAPSPSPSPPPPPPSRSPPPPPPQLSQSAPSHPAQPDSDEPLSPTRKNQRVQRILSSAAASAPSSSSVASAAAASASALASTRKPSFSRKGGEVETSQQHSKKVAKPNGGSSNVLQAARLKYAEAAPERSERLDKRAVEEARQRADAAEVKAVAAEQERRKLEEEVDNLKCELREAAAVELAVYSVVAQHGSSSHKIHAPARRLARIYMYACKDASQSARASTARTCAAAFVVVVRACENDVSRLTFWWSNVVVMREMVSQACDTAPSPAAAPEEDTRQHQLDWRETSTLASTLERIEAWIFGRIVECIWWQSLTPHMQSSAAAAEQSSAPSTPSSVVSRIKKSVRGLVVTDFEDSRQGMLSIEIWKAAFLDALQRICPVRAGGHDCGCLQAVTRMIIEQCVARLDVAMFNAILRDLEENVPTDPISDPITDLSVLPIPPDGVSFGGGAQLKNVINTWSTWLLTLTAENARGDEAAATAAAQENVERGTSHFTLLRAMSDLLMLPKDMLMDKTVRKEVCPALSLLLIRRVLSKFVPDEYSPDPIPPSLLAALNAEISMERQKVGEEDVSPTTVIMASSPPVVYFPPSPAVIANMVADMRMAATSPKLVRSSSLYRKGHTSDDELEELESPLFLLVDNGCIDSKEAAGLSPQIPLAQRYSLLRQAWS